MKKCLKKVVLAIVLASFIMYINTPCSSTYSYTTQGVNGINDIVDNY